MIDIRLIGLKEIDLENTDFLNWRGVQLIEVLKDNSKIAVDFWIKIDGLRPILEADAGSETLGIPDLAVANKGFSFTTEQFKNIDFYDILDKEIMLNKWLLCPYKFFCLWDEGSDALYYLTHATELALQIINPPKGIIGGVDDGIELEKVMCIPVKAQNMGSVEHTFGKGSNRRYTIDIKSVRLFKYSEVFK